MNGEKRKHTCTGCRDYDKTCAFLKQDCELLREKSVDYCFQCDVFPCDNLRRMDKSYREKYDMSAPACCDITCLCQLLAPE